MTIEAQGKRVVSRQFRLIRSYFLEGDSGRAEKLVGAADLGFAEFWAGAVQHLLGIDGDNTVAMEGILLAWAGVVPPALPASHSGLIHAR